MFVSLVFYSPKQTNKFVPTNLERLMFVYIPILRGYMCEYLKRLRYSSRP